MLSQCVFVSVLVKMGLSLSLLRVEFSLYRAQAKTLKVTSSEMEELQQKVKDLPGSSLEKLKELHSEVFTKVNWGRLVVFLNFADQLGLTEEEWEKALTSIYLDPSQPASFGGLDTVYRAVKRKERTRYRVNKSEIG